MLSNISWLNYWTVIGIILFLYYLAICFRYYLFDVKQILSGKSTLSFKRHMNNNSVEIFQQNFSPTIDQIKQEIRMILSDASERTLVKQELIFSLRLLFKKYSTIKKDSSFKTAINDYLLRDNSNYCSIHLSEEEVMSLWVN